MGGTIISPLGFRVGITENRGTKSCDLKVQLQKKGRVVTLKKKLKIKYRRMELCIFINTLKTVSTAIQNYNIHPERKMFRIMNMLHYIPYVNKDAELHPLSN